MSISNLTWDFVYSAIQTEFFKLTNTTNAACHSGISCGDKPSQWRTLSSSIHKDSSSYRIRVLLNSKRGKRNN